SSQSRDVLVASAAPAVTPLDSPSSAAVSAFERNQLVMLQQTHFHSPFLLLVFVFVGLLSALHQNHRFAAAAEVVLGNQKSAEMNGLAPEEKPAVDDVNGTRYVSDESSERQVRRGSDPIHNKC
ncbi:hypothetical protein M569_09528, partial [Genlisea aurea]